MSHLSTPIGSSHMWALARDWARFGLLYVTDGVVGGERVLPRGWVNCPARLTPGSEDYGYGAGFWTNRGTGSSIEAGMRAGMPGDLFMARGSQGQYLVVIPSAGLVVVRFGMTYTPPGDIETVERVLGDAVAGTGAS